MITNIRTYPFGCSVTVNPGDSLVVNHYPEEGTKFEVCRHKADFTATWTHSILFELNGQTQWLLGNQETIEWLNGQALHTRGV